MKNKVNKNWQSFKSVAIPENASPQQSFDMELAFYAGAHCTFSDMINASAELPMEEAEKFISEMHKELESFSDSVQQKAKDLVNKKTH